MRTLAVWLLALSVMLQSDASLTIFTFSPGGDRIEAIAWSAQAGRFYRLLECC